MDEPERRTERETDRTIIVDSDRGGGGAGLAIGIVVVLALAALLYFLFARNVERAADEANVNVNIDAPEVQVPAIETPDINIVTPPEQDEPAQPEQNESGT